MLQDHIAKIEASLRDAKNVPPETRAELLNLLAALKADLPTLPPVEKKPSFAGSTIHELTESVEGFETSHPELVANVNRLAVILSNMGI